MNILGLDIGFARVGVAIGNTDIGLAFPRETSPFEKYLCDIKNIITTENIEEIVIGDPKPMNGDLEEKNMHRKKILAEKEKLEEIFSLPVHVFDERCTSLIATASLHEMGVKAKDQKKSKDSVAASIILQGWIDMSSKQN